MEQEPRPLLKKRGFIRDVMDKDYDVIFFFKKTFVLRRAGVAIFADIIKILTMFIKTILKDSRKVKRIRNYVSKWNLYLYFLKKQNLLISR